MPPASVGSSCPLCGQPLARDVKGRGWVRHLARPELHRILADSDKKLTVSDRLYVKRTGRCPYLRGERDPS